MEFDNSFEVPLPPAEAWKVLLHSNHRQSGAGAQYGRGVGIIQPTASQIRNQFATRLKDKLGQEQPVAAAPAAASTAPGAAAPSRPAAQSSPSIVPPSAPPPPATPISGFSLMAKVFWTWLTGLFKRSS